MTQPLDFESPQHEAIALIRLLRQVQLDMTRGRSEGVCELLERLIILTDDAREVDGRIHCRVQVIAIAARIHARVSRTERTVQNWTKDAKALGLIEADYRSQHYGGHSWNNYTINMHRLRTLLSEGRNGVKRGESISGLRPESISGLGPETVSGLKHRRNYIEENNNKPVVVVVSDASPVLKALEATELGDPLRTYRQAKDRLQLTDEQIMSRIATWRELPQERRLPGVLYNWLTKPRSYDASMSQPGQPAQLRLRRLPTGADERRRADLIAYGRKRGWSHDQIQLAVTRIEDEMLNQQTMEPIPCPQSASHQPQLALVLTEKPQRRRW